MEKTAPKQQPLSPHLGVYRLPLTVILSITHRAMGAALSVGAAVVVWMLVAAATGEEAYRQFMAVAGSPIGVFCMVGWSVALFYHAANGVRHLFWDMGFLFSKPAAFKSSLAVLAAAALLTALFWCQLLSR